MDENHLVTPSFLEQMEQLIIKKFFIVLSNLHLSSIFWQNIYNK